MNIPYSTLRAAFEAAETKAIATGTKWYVNRLASSGAMRFEVSSQPITDTSFGGGLVCSVQPRAKEAQ